MMIVMIACAMFAFVPAAEASPASDDGGDVGPVAGKCVDVRPDDPMHPIDVYDC